MGTRLIPGELGARLTQARGLDGYGQQGRASGPLQPTPAPGKAASALKVRRQCATFNQLGHLSIHLPTSIQPSAELGRTALEF